MYIEADNYNKTYLYYPKIKRINLIVPSLVVESFVFLCLATLACGVQPLDARCHADRTNVLACLIDNYSTQTKKSMGQIVICSSTVSTLKQTEQ